MNISYTSENFIKVYLKVFICRIFRRKKENDGFYSQLFRLLLIHLFNCLGTYPITPNIPGMPTMTALSPNVTNSHEVSIASPGPINAPGPQREQNPVHGSTTINIPVLQREQNPVPANMTAGFNVPQSHVVTTPISLPGMPPITVTASLPQDTPFYPSVLQQQNQLPPSINSSTVAPTMTLPTSTQ